MTFDGRGQAVQLTFRNVGASPSFHLPDGVRGDWDAASATLSLPACGRVNMRVDAKNNANRGAY